MTAKQPKKTGRPKLRYQEAMEAVSNGIKNGQYSLGEKLPGMKEMSQELGMHFLTVRRAMTELAKKGLVEIRHGAGTFVTERPLARKTTAIRLGIACRTFMLHIGKHHPVVMACLAGAHRRCKPPEFILQPLFYDQDRFVEQIGQTILTEGLSGVLILAGGMRNEDYEFLRDHRVHVVSFSSSPYHDSWTITVRTDKAAALRQSVEHLRSLGHKRIAYITYLHKDEGDNTHRRFARLAFDHRLGNPDELMVLVGNTNLDTHWEDVEKLFGINPPPTAAIVSDEFLADVVLDGCERRGIRVPDELSIVAMQDAKPEGHRIPLTATTTAEEITQKAFTAIDLLVRRVSGDFIESMDVAIPPQLIVKASSGPVMAGIDLGRNGK
jgi:DNA-binding LacI/PurR family transcriptional regulator